MPKKKNEAVLSVFNNSALQGPLRDMQPRWFDRHIEKCVFLYMYRIMNELIFYTPVKFMGANVPI